MGLIRRDHCCKKKGPNTHTYVIKISITSYRNVMLAMD